MSLFCLSLRCFGFSESGLGRSGGLLKCCQQRAWCGLRLDHCHVFATLVSIPYEGEAQKCWECCLRFAANVDRLFTHTIVYLLSIAPFLAFTRTCLSSRLSLGAAESQHRVQAQTFKTRLTQESVGSQFHLAKQHNRVTKLCPRLLSQHRESLLHPFYKGTLCLRESWLRVTTRHERKLHSVRNSCKIKLFI